MRPRNPGIPDLRPICKRWGVTTPTARAWAVEYGEGTVTNAEALARQLLKRRKLGSHVRKVARSIVGGSKPDPEVKAEAGRLAIEAINDLPTLARELQGHIDRCNKRISAAIASEDLQKEEAATDRMREFISSLAQVRKLQATLGQDAGELVSKSECIRVIHAWASRAAIGVQRIRDSVSKDGAGKSERELWDILEDKALTEMFAAPFKRAVNLKAECSLPDWFVNEIVETFANFVANGKAELEAVRL